ncbi:MAG: SOUL family heme-binding protein [Prosthecobacter sp.]
MTLLLLAPVLLAVFWFASNTRAATETPEYRVIRTDDKFEIRDYPALSLATSPMAADGMNGGFGNLFRFITGTTETKEKIEMTSPVLLSNTTESKTLSFIMPQATVSKGVPKPAGNAVSLTSLPATRFAVLRFPGSRNAENEKNAIASLRAWMTEQKLTGKGEPLFAYYDPPWTPIPFRRNEVLIRIEKDS